MYQVEHPQDVARFEEVDHVEPEGRGYWISKAWLRGTAILSEYMQVADSMTLPQIGNWLNLRCTHPPKQILHRMTPSILTM